ncbi:MAG: hypothetical protein LBI19_08075 [Oscillospiraceae bacterium]|nr:hypothetical protein [Oscillospiraceae bacterium]
MSTARKHSNAYYIRKAEGEYQPCKNAVSVRNDFKQDGGYGGNRGLTPPIPFLGMAHLCTMLRMVRAVLQMAPWRQCRWNAKASAPSAAI